MLLYIWSKMLCSSQDAFLKLSKTTSPQNLYLSDCITLYIEWGRGRVLFIWIIENFGFVLLSNFWWIVWEKKWRPVISWISVLLDALVYQSIIFPLIKFFRKSGQLGKCIFRSFSTNWYTVWWNQMETDFEEMSSWKALTRHRDEEKILDQIIRSKYVSLLLWWLEFLISFYKNPY